MGFLCIIKMREDVWLNFVVIRVSCYNYIFVYNYGLVGDIIVEIYNLSYKLVLDFG